MAMYNTISSPAKQGAIDFADLQRAPELREVAPQIADLTKDDLLKAIQKHRRWRYHHGLDALRERNDTYHAYCNRIDAMKAAIDEYFDHFGVKLDGKTAADLASSEGFFTNHFLQRGLSAFDAFELSELGIERMHLIQAYLDLPITPTYQIDFEHPFWCKAINKKYDIVFCLGILYHLENPTLFLRNVRELVTDYLVLETDTPKSENSFAGLGCFHLHNDQVTIRPGDVRQVLEFRPDRDALVNILLHVGFREVTVLPAASRVRDKYFDQGLKSMVIARV